LFTQPELLQLGLQRHFLQLLNIIKNKEKKSLFILNTQPMKKLL